MLSLFIYGSLKRGHSRSSLLDDQHFLGERKTSPKYRLFKCSSFPALVEASRADVTLPGISIEGELRQVDDSCLAMLDVTEGVGSGLFERRQIELLDYDGEAEAYFWLSSVEGLEDCGEHWL